MAFPNSKSLASTTGPETCYGRLVLGPERLGNRFVGPCDLGGLGRPGFSQVQLMSVTLPRDKNAEHEAEIHQRYFYLVDLLSPKTQGGDHCGHAGSCDEKPTKTSANNLISWNQSSMNSEQNALSAF